MCRPRWNILLSGQLACCLAMLAPFARAAVIENPHEEFRVEIPGDWARVEGRSVRRLFPGLTPREGVSAEGRAYFYYPRQAAEGPRPSVTLIVRKHDFPVRFDPRSRALLEDLHRRMFQELQPQSTLSDLRVIDGGGRNALRYQLQWPGADGPTRMIRYLISGRRFNYILLARGPAANWERHAATLEAIVDSFEVAPPPPSGRRAVNAAALPLLGALLLGLLVRARRQQRQAQNPA